MNPIYLFLLVTIGILYSLYTRYRTQRTRQKAIEERYAAQNPEIQFDYNRFNTKKERNTTVDIHNDKVFLETDIQNIQIANEALSSRISSDLNGTPLVFQLIVQPFIKELFEFEGYKNFNQDGILIVVSFGQPTRSSLHSVDPISFLAESIPEEPKATYLDLNSFKVDKADNQVILKGNFLDTNEFTVSINYLDYRLTMEAPLPSIQNKSNFRDFDSIRIDEP